MLLDVLHLDFGEKIIIFDSCISIGECSLLLHIGS